MDENIQIPMEARVHLIELSLAMKLIGVPEALRAQIEEFVLMNPAHVGNGGWLRSLALVRRTWEPIRRYGLEREDAGPGEVVAAVARRTEGEEIPWSGAADGEDLVITPTFTIRPAKRS